MGYQQKTSGPLRVYDTASPTTISSMIGRNGAAEGKLPGSFVMMLPVGNAASTVSKVMTDSLGVVLALSAVVRVAGVLVAVETLAADAAPTHVASSASRTRASLAERAMPGERQRRAARSSSKRHMSSGSFNVDIKRPELEKASAQTSEEEQTTTDGANRKKNSRAFQRNERKGRSSEIK
jgi:hypothetical protein